MSNPDASKYKSKKYFIKKSYNKRLGLEVNLKGFLCSCNNRERDCVKESYNLLNEYADKLYLNPQDCEKGEDEDIGESLSKEIEELKQQGKPTEKRFQMIDTGAKNFLFIRTNLENPVQLAEAIVKDVHETKNQKTKFLLRLIPVEVTCKANLNDIGHAFEQLAEKHLKEAPQTFSVMFNHRLNNAVLRDDVIKLIGSKVTEARPDHKVDLKGAKLSIIVEIIKGFAFISIIPDYLKYKKYNLLSVCNQDQSVGD